MYAWKLCSRLDLVITLKLFFDLFSSSFMNFLGTNTISIGHLFLTKLSMTANSFIPWLIDLFIVNTPMIVVIIRFVSMSRSHIGRSLNAWVINLIQKYVLYIYDISWAMTEWKYFTALQWNVAEGTISMCYVLINMYGGDL
jgi:hypothetical protein